MNMEGPASLLGSAIQSTGNVRLKDLRTLSGAPPYRFVSYTDGFRQIPIRWLGYSYVFKKFIDLHQDYMEDVDLTDDLGLFTGTTLTYIAGHTLLHFAVAFTDAFHSGMGHCGLITRIAYVMAAVGECVVWNVIATVVLPYIPGFLVFHIADGLVLPLFFPENPIRHYLPGLLSALSLPACGPLIDSLADYVIDKVSPRLGMCPSVVFYRSFYLQVMNYLQIMKYRLK